MEEDKISNIFLNFNPELSDDNQFLSQLERNLRSVELVKGHNKQMKRNNRNAVIIAALAGFIVGMLFTMALPWLGDTVQHIRLSTYTALLPEMLLTDFFLFYWGAVGAAIVFVSFNTYELSLFLLRKKTRINR